jgi:hypothetical protein
MQFFLQHSYDQTQSSTHHQIVYWMGIVHPHLSCEHVDDIYIVKKQKGVDMKLSTLQQKKRLTI